ncbi:MAG: ribosome small subunit-dependent GTPase A [Saprospiraceae bacterium]|jgi:ribosome biogenesis GTPase|nr:ribosome small subunit-dependent GTPase A [Saprospiraceae bacterium]
MTQTGTVIKSTGSWYNVRLDADGAVLQCRIVGKFRLDDVVLTNPVAVGDQVEIQPEGAGQGMIKKILPRRNYVVRQSPRRKHDLHLLAANIDQAVLIVTAAHPNLKPGFIDRFLLMTEPHEIPVTIVFNKGDLYEDKDVAAFFAMKEIYEKIGYRVLATSVPERKGLDALVEVLKNKTTLLSGQSGVGKSSLINAIQPNLGLRTGEISDYSGKGQHTTTFAEMFELDFGGRIIDTPGIKMLAFNNKDPQNVAHAFREFFELSEHCKFGASCLHRNEPGCAVRKAVAEGGVSEIRYANYLGILEEVEDQNYWERWKDM